MTTAGWPWMKDAATAEQAIPPVHERDDRPALKDLFTEHRALIDQVATELATDPLYDATKHDDLWIVRFLLSHKKNVKAAVKSAKHALLFRAEHKLDEKDIRYFPINKNVPDEAFRRYLQYCRDDTYQFVIPDAKLGVVAFLDLSGIDQHALVQHVDEPDWVAKFIYLAEWTHQWIDYQSRTTGRLTSSVRLVDLGRLTFPAMNRDCHQREGRAMKVTEDCYPQMLQRLYICHSPSWVQAVWRLLRPLFPQRVVEKADFIAPETNAKERERLLKYISIENLPTRYGGQNDAWPLEFALPK